MLKGKPTKHGTGITIYGDLYDLESLYNSISQISEYIGEERSDSIFYMSMAYEIRKSWENNREIFKVGKPEYWELTYKGFNMYWPDFLVLLNLLRQRVGYLGISPEIQSNVYRLEHLCYESLREFDENKGEGVVKFMKETKMLFDPNLFQILDKVRLDHLSENNGKSRFMKLLKNMKPFIPFSKEYMSLNDKLERQAKELNCSVEDLKYSDEIMDSLKYKW